MKISFIKYFLPVLIISLLASCAGEDYYAPKPKGYFRIAFPEKIYTRYDSTCPFSFDVPTYALVLPDRDQMTEPCWLNVEFPKFNSTLHISYKKLDHNLDNYLEDSRELVIKHQVKASGIEEQFIERDSIKVYGLIYNIEGNAASSLQFHLTDSVNHFLRGSLYFNSKPNKDSIAPVLDFIRKDMIRMIESFRWKDY